MSKIDRIASNTPWEPIFGYVRAVRAGGWLCISGTTATDERGLIVGGGQMYVQARQALLNIKRHVEGAGLRLSDVVRTRAFVTDMSRFAEVARAHKEVMGEYPPAESCIEVSKLVHPDMLIEIEADVYAGGDATSAPPGSRAAEVRKPAPKVNRSAKKASPPPKKASRPKPRKKR